MDNLYLIIVIILFCLAISDLIVGVSNDAVNFLSSSFGSKAAPRNIILIIAAIGILVGATFSDGMMEVARKGIFHPDHFFFSEIMIIYFAVMITDVILLDAFNTLRLPTSTTVSIVFELLGAAVAVSIIKITSSGGSLSDLGEYINSAKALLIITGILLSVIIAFSIGALVQYIARLAFTFNMNKTIKYLGALWGGIAISAITYFILIKGAKGSSFINSETVAFIQDNTLLILALSFVGWTIILQLFMWFTKINVLKLIVLVGTFALAMAFAGNDLVNFIGVPLAGFESFKTFMADPGADPNLFSMAALGAKVKTPTIYLLIAGLIMVLTLWFSKKARSVTKTTLDLSRQDEGEERFESTPFSRSLVRLTRNINQFFSSLTPQPIKNTIEKRFNNSSINNSHAPDAPSFDLLRASVNLVVASILIAIGTSLKLPLSTTYVTFMVVMGTSLSDRAWGRESAVYRISGVITVITGWFFTAFSAFVLAFIAAIIIKFFGIYAIIVLTALASLLLYKTHIVFKKKERIREENSKLISDQSISIFETCTKNVTETLSSINVIYKLIINGLLKEDRKILKYSNKEVTDLNNRTKMFKDNIYPTIRKLQVHSVETGHYYVQVLDYLRETAHCLTFISNPAFNYIDNNHPSFNDTQNTEIKRVLNEVESYINMIIKTIEGRDFNNIDEIIDKQNNILDIINNYRKNQIKRIKSEEVGTRNSMLFNGILHETKSLLLYTINLLKAQRDFVIYKMD
ncbi:inorganic phosphate transporter [Bacteroidota bacterium]